MSPYLDDDNFEGGGPPTPPAPQSQPIPRVPQGSIPGLLGMILSGLGFGGSSAGAASVPAAGTTTATGAPWWTGTGTGPGMWDRTLPPGLPSAAASAAAPPAPGGMAVQQGTFDLPGTSIGRPADVQPPPIGGWGQIPGAIPLPRPRLPPPPPPSPPPATLRPPVPLTPPPAAQAQTGAPTAAGLPGLLGGFLNNSGNWIDAHRMQLLAMAGGLAGAPSIGTGIGRAFQGAAQAAPMDIQLQRANQTSQWLQSKGYEPAIANQLANNPTMMNAMLPYLMGIKQPVHVVTTDAFGEQHVRWYDPYSGQELPRPAGGTPGELDGSSMGGPGAGPLPPGVTQENLRDIDPTTGRRENLLKTYSPMAQSWIRGLADHNLDPMAAGLKQKGMLAAAVSDYDPNYNSELYGLIKGTEAKFNTGPEAQKVRSFNSAMQHLETLRQLAPALQGTDYPLINRLKNLFVSQGGGTAPGSFDAVKQIVGAEINNMIVAGGGGEGERDALRRSLDASKTPDQLNDILNHYQELGGAQLRSLEAQFDSGTYGKRPGQFRSHLLPESQAYLDKVKQQAAGGGGGGGGGGTRGATLPDAVRSQLKEGVVTTFGNGQKWTLQNGQPVQVP